MSSAVCKKKRALSSWYVMYCLWISCKIPARITACKSVSAKNWRKKGGAGARRVSERRSRLGHLREARRTHEIKDEVNVSVILSAHNIQETDDVVVTCELLQVHDLAKSALRVGRVSERVKALFERDDCARLLVHSLPHNAVRLRAKKDGGGRGGSCA